MNDFQIIERITNLYTTTFGEQFSNIELLPGAGSSRKYFRITQTNNQQIIACYGTDTQENSTFIYFSKKFCEAGINVPQVLASEANNEIYLISDLGKTDVLQAKSTLTDEGVEQLYQKILTDLLQIQLIGGKQIDFSRCLVRPEFDRTAMQWDLYYFKYYYLKISGLEFNEQKLEEDFCRLLDFLEKSERKYFMYRDFQSRNIMWNGKSLGYIDFQGGMRGALQYDVVSLLYQAKANLSPEMRESLLNFYIVELKKYETINEQEFRELFQGFVFIRILQTLGAYGFRGFIQHKPHFIQSIPQALENLKQHTPIINKIVKMPYLSALIEQLPELKITE